MLEDLILLNCKNRYKIPYYNSGTGGDVAVVGHLFRISQINQFVPFYNSRIPVLLTKIISITKVNCAYFKFIMFVFYKAVVGIGGDGKEG